MQLLNAENKQLAYLASLAKYLANHLNPVNLLVRPQLIQVPSPMPLAAAVPITFLALVLVTLLALALLARTLLVSFRRAPRLSTTSARSPVGQSRHHVGHVQRSR